MPATIKDVAKKAGVSISTVSRVINDSKPVSPESRRKVLDAIKKLNYQPNEVARSLVTKKSKLIGVIVDDIGSHYVAQIVRGIEEIGRMYDYDILLSSSYGNPETESRFVKLLMTKQVEGIILVSEILNTKLLDYMEDMNMKFIYWNKYYNIESLDTIVLDHKKAMTDIMEYLIENNHKNIMYVSQELEGVDNIEVEKIEAYEDCLKSIGSKPNVYTLEGRATYQAYNAGEDILNIIRKENITAVVCCHDNIAIGLNNYFYDNYIEVGKDISLVGYGDIKSASICRPSLTTIREPYYDIGAVAVRRILKSIENSKIDSRDDSEIVLPMRLIERKSTNKAK